MVKVIRNNGQTVRIRSRNLEKPAPLTRFDSTVDERDRQYETRKPEPRFTEYR